MGKRIITIIMLASVLYVSIIITKNASATSYVAQYIGAAVNGTWVKVNAAGNINIDIVPTSSGTLGISKDIISVETNANTGYRLYLSGMNGEDDGRTALYYNGNKNNPAKLLSVSSVNPTTLSSGYWGYAFPSSTVKTYAPASSYESVALNGSTIQPSDITSLTFSGIEQNYSFLYSSNSANENNPDELDIYYGAMADYSVLNGSYHNVIVYTAFVEGNDTISVTDSVTNGGQMTIATEIQDLATPVSASQIEVSLYDSEHPNISVGSCTDIEISGNNNGTIGNPLSFICTFHATPYTSDNNVRYDLAAKIDLLGNGVYLQYTAPQSWSYQSDIQTISTMQEMTPAICTATPAYDISGSTYTLTDNRGATPKSYLIRKLADERCWMVQNLALEGGVEISPSDSNVESDFTLPDDNEDFYHANRASMNNGSHIDATPDNPTDNTGAWYNWNAATANFDLARVRESGSSNISICPKNWHLPTASLGGEYNLLFESYSRNKSRFDAAWMPALSGRWDGYKHGESGRVALWWSATVYNKGNAYRLYEAHDNTISDGIDSAFGYQYGRYAGYNIRCVADKENN